MYFNSHKPIYLQIGDDICEKILVGELSANDRLLSVREYGAGVGVNPNTVMRTYEKLTADGIIYNKRGIGYFICENAKKIILKKEKDKFLKEDLPQILKRMKILGIDYDILSDKE